MPPCSLLEVFSVEMPLCIMSLLWWSSWAGVMVGLGSDQALAAQAEPGATAELVPMLCPVPGAARLVLSEVPYQTHGSACAWLCFPAAVCWENQLLGVGRASAACGCSGAVNHLVCHVRKLLS